MKAILRWIILWALDRKEPEYDPAALDAIAAEHKAG
jgi:hypothetical protein